MHLLMMLLMSTLVACEQDDFSTPQDIMNQIKYLSQKYANNYLPDESTMKTQPIEDLRGLIRDIGINLRTWVRNEIILHDLVMDQRSDKVPTDCLDIFASGKRTSGTYTIYPPSSGTKVFCDLESNSGDHTECLNQLKLASVDNIGGEGAEWMGTCRMQDSEYADCTSKVWTTAGDTHICKIDGQLKIPAKTLFSCKHGCTSNADAIANGLQSNRISVINIARAKNVTTSSIHPLDPASHAVDGNYGTHYHSLTDKRREWIMIDLGKNYLVTQVKITGRSHHKERFGFLKISLSTTFNPNANFAGYPRILNIPGAALTGSHLYNVNTIRCGRYIVFAKTIVGIFEAQEIEVYGVIIN